MSSPRERAKTRTVTISPGTNIHLERVQDVAGFAVETAEKGQTAKVQTRGSVISDDPIFYTYIEQIGGLFLHGLYVHSLYQFLVLIHEDSSADLYINDFPLSILIMPKGDVRKGQFVRTCDIADIRKLQFPAADIKDTDKVICCLKVKWKFGLFFDLHREHPLDLEAMQTDLGAIYRYLSFQYVYDALESKPDFHRLLEDGWFPFIEIIASEFKQMSHAYKNLPDPQPQVDQVVSKFDKARIERISGKWWNKRVFRDKRLLIETGLNSYLKNDSQGFVACIKTLVPEIEGIIRLHYFQETGRGKNVRVPDLIKHVIEKGRVKSGSDFSLFLPRAFFAYLERTVFPRFDLEKGDVSLSRHTSSHGVAKAADYTKSRALQMLLILDQIYFYI